MGGGRITPIFWIQTTKKKTILKLAPENIEITLCPPENIEITLCPPKNIEITLCPPEKNTNKTKGFSWTYFRKGRSIQIDLMANCLVTEIL